MTVTTYIQPQHKRSAFIWMREFSRDRLEKIQTVRRNWEILFDEPGDRGHYARWQWLGFKATSALKREDITAPMEGVTGKIDLLVITAREWFAREVFRLALAKTQARYPGYDKYRYLDGFRIGERILEFESEAWDLAERHLWTSLWAIIKDDNFSIQEGLFLEPSPPRGDSQRPGQSLNERCERSTERQRAVVVKNVEQITEEDVMQICRTLAAGETLPCNPAPIAFSFDDIREGFIELTMPELTLLNWHDARPPLGEADLALHHAAYRLDREGMERALQEGANVNALSEDGEGVLHRLIWGYLDQYYQNQAGDYTLKYEGGKGPDHLFSETEVASLLKMLLDRGAHPDLHGPGEPTALINAVYGTHVAIVETLLDYGATAAIECYWDKYPGEWPTSWDSAYFDSEYEHDERARTIYHRLLKCRPNPLWTQEAEEEAIAVALGLAVPKSLAPTDSNQDVVDAVEEAEEPAEEEVILLMPDDPVVTAWLAEYGNSMPAQACVRYALAFNTLNPDWLAGLFPANFVYESQHVFSALKGRAAVMHYLRGKLQTLSATPPWRRPRFALARLSNDAAGLAGYQK